MPLTSQDTSSGTQWCHIVVYLALYEDNTCLCFYASLLLCVNSADLQYACVFIFMDVVHSSGLYT